MRSCGTSWRPSATELAALTTGTLDGRGPLATLCRAITVVFISGIGYKRGSMTGVIESIFDSSPNGVYGLGVVTGFGVLPQT